MPQKTMAVTELKHTLQRHLIKQLIGFNNATSSTIKLSNTTQLSHLPQLVTPRCHEVSQHKNTLTSQQPTSNYS